MQKRNQIIAILLASVVVSVMGVSGLVMGAPNNGGENVSILNSHHDGNGGNTEIFSLGGNGGGPIDPSGVNWIAFCSQTEISPADITITDVELAETEDGLVPTSVQWASVSRVDLVVIGSGANTNDYTPKIEYFIDLRAKQGSVEVDEGRLKRIGASSDTGACEGFLVDLNSAVIDWNPESSQFNIPQERLAGPELLCGVAGSSPCIPGPDAPAGL